MQAPVIGGSGFLCSPGRGWEGRKHLEQPEPAQETQDGFLEKALVLSPRQASPCPCAHLMSPCRLGEDHVNPQRSILGGQDSAVIVPTSQRQPRRPGGLLAQRVQSQGDTQPLPCLQPPVQPLTSGLHPMSPAQALSSLGPWLLKPPCASTLRSVVSPTSPFPPGRTASGVSSTDPSPPTRLLSLYCMFRPEPCSC